MTGTHQTDYLVIGAGAAGCVVAGRLAEADARVILAEAGRGDQHPITKVPGTAFLASVSSERNWNFETEPMESLGGRKMRWNQGRILGGSSSINGMIYMRGHSREYDAWRQLGCDGWSFDEVLAHFRRSEGSARGTDAWHSSSGPVATRPSNTTLPICDAFLDAAREAGFPVVEDLNANVVEGFGRFDINVRGGRRISAATAYVTPIRNRTNFTLLLGSLALRILFEGTRAVGAEILRNGRRETIRVEREIVLCAGAINSPQLLMLSGIGPADHLRELGVPIIVDAPQVGSNLANHPAYQLKFACANPITAFSYTRPMTAVGLALRYALTRGGPLGESYVAQGGVFRTDPALDVADSIVVMAPALVTRGGVGARWRDLFPDRHGFGVSVSLARPRSRGTIRLRSADPTHYPAIQPNYLVDPQDARTLVRAVQIMRDMMRQPSICKHIACELAPGDLEPGEAALETEIRQRLGTYSHPMGSCRMGGDASSVVDPQLRVRGVDGLRIADASIMPTPLAACTHGPTIMIGEKAASLIKSIASRQLGSY